MQRVTFTAREAAGYLGFSYWKFLEEIKAKGGENMVIDFDRYRQTRSLGLSIPFGERVAIARKDQGLTQEQLGEHLGYTQQNMSRLEIGKVKFTTATAAAAAIALNKSNILLYYCNECPVYQAFNELEKNKRPKPA